MPSIDVRADDDDDAPMSSARPEQDIRPRVRVRARSASTWTCVYAGAPSVPNVRPGHISGRGLESKLTPVGLGGSGDVAADAAAKTLSGSGRDGDGPVCVGLEVVESMLDCVRRRRCWWRALLTS